MPNLSDFLQIGDKLYCWDSEIEEYIQLDKKRIVNLIAYKKIIAAYKKNSKEASENGSNPNV